MSSQNQYEQEPKILDVTQTDKNEYRLDLSNTRPQDVFATLRFHIPDETLYYQKISILFENAVQRGMLKNATILVDDEGNNQNIDNIKFHRVVVFSDETTADQARDAFMYAYRHKTDIKIHDIEELVLTKFISSNLLPAGGIVFESTNEIVTATMVDISNEMSELTSRYYNGQSLGGPILE